MAYWKLEEMDWMKEIGGNGHGGFPAQLIKVFLIKISFDNDQFAYRKNLSCQHAVFKLIQDSIEGFNKGHITIAVLIDLEGAFDALWQQGIIYQLHKAKEVKLLISYGTSNILVMLQ